MIIEKYYYTPALTKEYLEVLVLNNRVVATGELVKNGPSKLPRITVCGLYDTETGMIKLGWSRCSSKDCFVKKEGRRISKERATNSPYKEVFIGPSKISESFVELAKGVEEEVFNMQYPIKF